jgi:hypothetical protein
MKKILIVILTLMLPLAWTWAAGEDQKAEAVDESATMITPVKEGNLLDSSSPIPEPPIITTNIITQDFEEAWTCTGPPTNWTIINGGTEGQQAWWNQDWYKYYNSTWVDTVARFYYSPAMESTYNEWLITPDVVLPGAAACTLTFKTWYDDYSTTSNYDTAYVKISTDGGSNWTILATWGTDQGTNAAPVFPVFDITSYAGQTVKVAFNLQTFRQNYLSAAQWQIDKVKVIADAATLLNEEFNSWGPWGNNPPTGWTILDNGIPYAAQGACNANDWMKGTYWTSGTARIYYVSTYYEWIDDWLVSPTFSITAGNACTLSVVEYYYHSTTTLEDHGYIKVSTDGGSTWPNTIADHTATLGSTSVKTTFKYDLSAFAGQSNLKVAFQFVNDAAGNSDEWRIDDVSVDEFVPPTEDIDVTSIDSPNILEATGSIHTITATLTQMMADSTLLDSIEFKVESSVPAVVFADTTYPGVYIHGFESLQFSSTAQWTASSSDWYTVTVTL